MEIRVPASELHALTFKVILQAIDSMLDDSGASKHEAFNFVYLLLDRSLARIPDRISAFLGLPIKTFEATLPGTMVLPLFHSYVFQIGQLFFDAPWSREYSTRRCLADYLIRTTADADED